MFDKNLFNQCMFAELIGKRCIPLVDIKSGYKSDYMLPAGRRCVVSSVTIAADSELRISVRELNNKGYFTAYSHSFSLEKFNRSFIRG